MATKKPARLDRPRSRVNETVVQAIQLLIQHGEVKVGDRLPPERQLAGQLGVSRASVREALRALELSGFVRSRHGEGNFVVAVPGGSATLPLSQFVERHRASLIELFDARKAFEPPLAAVAAERASREDVERLRVAVEEQQRDVGTGDLDAAFRDDRLFHQAIAEATGNPTLIRLHGFLSDLVAHGSREAIENDARRAQSNVDHRRIYQAIARRDGAAATVAMRQHLENVEAIAMRALKGYERTAAMIPTSLFEAERRSHREASRDRPPARSADAASRRPRRARRRPDFS